MARAGSKRTRNGQSVEPGQTSEKSPPAARPVTTGEIEERAYQIYLERGGGDGDPLSDWLQAERELCGGEP